MDLSWCIICDRHCIEENLYCSESCRLKDSGLKGPIMTMTPPSSPLLEPYFSSFERRPSMTLSRSPRSPRPTLLFGSSPSSDYSLSESLL